MAYNKTPKLGWSASKFMFSFSTFEIEDIVSVSWEDEREKELLYGAGSEPIGYGVGKSKYAGSITLYLEQVLFIQSQVPDGKLTSILPFDFIIQFLPEGSNFMQTVTLRNCSFTSSKVAIKSGDLSVEVELPMICSGIEVS